MKQYLDTSVVFASPASAVEISHNRKIGAVSATSASQASCPPYCPFMAEGCYAEHGPMAWLTRRLNRCTWTDPVAIAKAEAEAIGKLTGTRPMRVHVVGDCTSDATALIVADAVRQYKLRGIRGYRRKPAPVWAYTHAWRDIKRRSWGTVSILASCESIAQVRRARAKGYATALVVDRFTQPTTYIVDGLKILPCPYQTKRAANCEQCGLCLDDQKLKAMDVVIGFEAHGSRANTVRKQLVQISLMERAA